MSCVAGSGSDGVSDTEFSFKVPRSMMESTILRLLLRNHRTRRSLDVSLVFGSVDRVIWESLA